ncbi:hypothetical protein IKD82_01805 [Candidatus Saccharibacteria bacterium]|nr:hypothetical protein [Candidatus Saccharibacteria bacterium]
MVLTIENATVGYNAENVDDLIKSIKTEVIDNAISSFDGNFETLQQSVEEIWQGESEKKFIATIKDDIDLVKKGLNTIYQNLEGEISLIVSKMADADKKVFERH